MHGRNYCVFSEILACPVPLLRARVQLGMQASLVAPGSAFLLFRGPWSLRVRVSPEHLPGMSEIAGGEDI